MKRNVIVINITVQGKQSDVDLQTSWLDEAGVRVWQHEHHAIIKIFADDMK